MKKKISRTGILVAFVCTFIISGSLVPIKAESLEPIHQFSSQCAEDPDYIYSTKREPESVQKDKYLQITSYSSVVDRADSNKSETGAFSVSVNWSNDTLSASDPTKNTVTIEFFDQYGRPAKSVVFKKEENPGLLFMDMKMMKVAHTNYLCRMLNDAIFELSGHKLIIKNINFVMASNRSKGHLWFFNHLKAEVNGKTDIIKRLDIVPDIKK